MRIVSFKYILIFATFLSVLFFSCTKEENTDSVDITGIWKSNDEASENNVFDSQSYPVEIKQINDTLYEVSNFANLGENKKIKFCCKSTDIVIPNSKLDNYKIYGSGFIRTEKEYIKLTYYLDNERIISKWSR